MIVNCIDLILSISFNKTEASNDSHLHRNFPVYETILIVMDLTIFTPNDTGLL